AADRPYLRRTAFVPSVAQALWLEASLRRHPRRIGRLRPPRLASPRNAASSPSCLRHGGVKRAVNPARSGRTGRRHRRVSCLLRQRDQGPRAAWLHNISVVLAYFGYPTAHENDAERAIIAGLAILKAIGTLHLSLALLRTLPESINRDRREIDYLGALDWPL